MMSGSHQEEGGVGNARIPVCLSGATECGRTQRSSEFIDTDVNYTCRALTQISNRMYVSTQH